MLETGHFSSSYLNLLIRMNKMEESTISNAFPNVKQQVIEYDEQYNNSFRPISNKPILTVEISPTGSGKSTFYKNSPNTIMLMPSNAMVLQNDGMISLNKALELDKNNTKKYRTQWDQIDKTKCDYMTYDKFYGHVIEGSESVSNMNIIIDEADILLASDNKRYQKLAIALLKKDVVFKELKLISATLRVETLALFHQYEFDINIYQKKDFAPHIYFVKEFPKVDSEQRTLIFINSVDKMYQIEKHLKDKYQGIKVMILKAGDDLPTEQEIKSRNVILSTSIIRQGYSIQAQIDKVIIHNVNNPEGAIGILQYMARPRNQSPEVYVIRASTHFDMDKKPKGKDELNLRESTLDIIEQQNIPNTTSVENLASALCIEEWATKVKQSDYHNNPVLSSYLFEKAMKNIELYMTDGVFMKLSINDFLPHATIDIDYTLTETESISLGKLNISDYTEKLALLKSVEDVRSKISKMIEDINNAKDIDISMKKRLKVKLEKISKIEPYRDFIMDEVLYDYTDTIIVKQMIDEVTFNRCKWHQFNLDKNIYTLINTSIKSTRILKEGDEQTVSKIDNKFKQFIKPLKVGKTTSGTSLLGRMYSFDSFKLDESTQKPVKIKFNNSSTTEFVIITSLYTVEKSWYVKVENL
jgi:hypothetical protein